MVKLSTELMGVIQLSADWGEILEGDVMVDSAAALGVVRRKGCGKLRHVRVGELWVQEKQETGELGFKKVDGKENPADAGTKYLSEDKMEKYMGMALQASVEGRAESSLRI